MKAAQDIVIAPIITEKTMSVIADKKYTFKVATDANKVEIAEAVDYGAYVITSIKKYADSHKTIAEIFATDEKWLRWVANNYNPRNAKAVEDVEAIKKFLETK